MELSNELGVEVVQQFNRIAGNRGTWEAHWQEIAERMLPSSSELFQARGGSISQGKKKTDLIYDSTAAIALNRFAAILDSLLTPRNQTWHRLMVSNGDLQKDRQVILFFEEVNRALFKYRYAPKANFASQNQQNYKSVGAFGNGCMFTDALSGDLGIRYKAVHLSETYFVENHQGQVDEVWRYFPLTARQVMQKWGQKHMDRIPDRIKDCVKVSPEQLFFFIHCVRPRAEPDYERLDYKGMPYESYYVSVETQTVMEESGFTSFPYAISRYEQSSNETYGRSPAMDVLPAVKTLNEEKKTMLKQGHRAVDPVLLTHDDGVLDGFSVKPGAINSGGVTADGRPLVHALPVGNLMAGKELMDDERSIINDAFLVNIFQILVETPAMTATEIMERAKEKGILLAPTIGRQQSEYLGPMIEREIDVLSKQNLLPPMPQALLDAKGEYRIEYDSPLTRAQRAEEASGLMRTIETALNVVNVTQNPEPLDFFNWDIIIPEISAIQGVPAKWMRDMKVVQGIRQGRAKQAQQDQMVQAAPGAAAMMKSVAAVKKQG
jgi:hypothetical protein